MGSAQDADCSTRLRVTNYPQSWWFQEHLTVLTALVVELRPGTMVLGTSAVFAGGGWRAGVAASEAFHPHPVWVEMARGLGTLGLSLGMWSLQAAWAS